MTNLTKLIVSVVAALIFSLVLSVQPIYRIFPALLNESLSVAFWMLVSGWVLFRYRLSFKRLLRTTWTALLFCGIFLGALIAQFVAGHSAPYGGYVALHAGAAAACVLAILAGAAFFKSEKSSSNPQHIFIALALFLVALVQALIGWLQFLELHLAFPWIALQGVGGRAFGNLRQYNLFALLMLLGLLALGLLVKKSQATESVAINGEKKILSRSKGITSVIYLFALLLVGALVASISRFGMLMCIFFLLLSYLDYRDQQKARAMFFLMLPLMYAAWYLIFVQLDAAGVLPYYGTQRAISVDALSRESNSDRLQIWSVSIQLIKSYPWFGLGYGQLPYYSAAEQIGWDFHLLLDYAHNFFLQWALDFGLPIAFALLISMLFLAWHLRSLLRRSDERILAVILIFPVVHELIEFPLHYPTFLMPWCFLIGILLASVKGGAEYEEEISANFAKTTQIRLTKVFVTAVPAALALMSIFTIFDSAKPGQLFQPNLPVEPYEAIKLAYTTVAFEHIADFAVVQTVPITSENAAQLHKLSAKVAKLRFDVNVALVYMQASALDGRMCVAKSIAYRLAMADKKTQDKLFQILGKRAEPQFSQLETFARSPYYIKWLPDSKGDC